VIEQLPLTANSKIDKMALTTLACALNDADADVEAPRTPAEHRLATAWATVLGVAKDQIGRRDDFFERGGSSLSAVKLVVALNRAVSLQDVIRVPVLTDLAELLDSRTPSRPARRREHRTSTTPPRPRPDRHSSPTSRSSRCHHHPWHRCSKWISAPAAHRCGTPALRGQPNLGRCASGHGPLGRHRARVAARPGPQAP
jgi:hypothetical protein